MEIDAKKTVNAHRLVVIIEGENLIEMSGHRCQGMSIYSGMHHPITAIVEN
jgi:hypothetical protein